MEKNQKYLAGISVLLLVVLIIISCFVGDKNNNSTSKSNNSNEENPQVIIENAQKESSSVKEEERKELPEIKMDTYLDYYSGEEKKLVLLARHTCSYCQIAEPIIENLAYKYDLDISYLNTEKFKDDDESKLVKSDEFFSNGFGTPLLLIVGENKIIDKVDGATDTAHYTDFLKVNGYID